MLAGAFSCHHLNAHRGDEYIVPEASDGDVADTACPARILLVEQQVSLPLFKDRNRHTSDFHVAPRQLTECSPAIASAPERIPPPLPTYVSGDSRPQTEVFSTRPSSTQ